MKLVAYGICQSEWKTTENWKIEIEKGQHNLKKKKMESFKTTSFIDNDILLDNA